MKICKYWLYISSFLFIFIFACCTTYYFITLIPSCTASSLKHFSAEPRFAGIVADEGNTRAFTFFTEVQTIFSGRNFVRDNVGVKSQYGMVASVCNVSWIFCRINFFYLFIYLVYLGSCQWTKLFSNYYKSIQKKIHFCSIYLVIIICELNVL